MMGAPIAGRWQSHTLRDGLWAYLLIRLQPWDSETKKKEGTLGFTMRACGRACLRIAGGETDDLYLIIIGG